jgi:hypothetical protein
MQGHGDEAFGHGEGVGTPKTTFSLRDYCRRLWRMAISVGIGYPPWLIALLPISIAVFYATFCGHGNVKELECCILTFTVFVIPLLLVISTVAIVRVICADRVAELEAVVSEEPSSEVLPPLSSARSEINAVNGLVGFDDLISRFSQQRGDDRGYENVVYKLSFTRFVLDGDGEIEIIPESDDMASSLVI